MTDTQIAPMTVELWFIDAPVDLEDDGITKDCSTVEEAVHYLWAYVQGRIANSGERDLLEPLLPDFYERYNLSSDDLMDIEDEELEQLLSSLSAEDACEVIDSYFNRTCDDDWRSEYTLTQRFAGGDPESLLSLADIYKSTPVDLSTGGSRVRPKTSY